MDNVIASGSPRPSLTIGMVPAIPFAPKRRSCITPGCTNTFWQKRRGDNARKFCDSCREERKRASTAASNRARYEHDAAAAVREIRRDLFGERLVALCAGTAETGPTTNLSYEARPLDAVRMLLRGVPQADIRLEHGRVVADHAAGLSGRQRLVMLARACGDGA